MIDSVIRIRSDNNFFYFVVENPQWTFDGKVSGSAVYTQFSDGEWQGPFENQQLIDLPSLGSYCVEHLNIESWLMFCQDCLENCEK